MRTSFRFASTTGSAIGPSSSPASSSTTWTGPTTNPDQTTIDPAFGMRYIDRQRNLVFTCYPHRVAAPGSGILGQRHPVHALLSHPRPHRPCGQVQRRLLRAIQSACRNE